MADFNRCISALNKAAGRELDPDELQGMFERIQKTARDLKAGRIADDGGPQNLGSVDGLIRRAAEIEAKNMIAEADRKARNVVRDAKTIATRQAEIKAMRDAKLDGVDAVRRLLVNDADGKADQFSLETRATGVSQYLKSRVQDTWAAMGRDFMEYLSREDKITPLVREIRGEDTGDATAKKGAEVWRKVTEEARQWFNEAGGNIGHLDDWGMPQHHSQELVSRAGSERWTKGMDGKAKAEASRAAWIEFVLPRLDRERYTDAAGNPMSDRELVDFMSAAWDTIATNGASKIAPGQAKGTGKRANRHAEERQVHFKDAQSTIEYWDKFGERTVPDILLGHLETMAKDIAFIEHFGTNPDATYRMLRDEAVKDAKISDPTMEDKINGAAAKLDRLWDYASGKSKPVASQAISNGFDVVRNLNSAGKLGSAAWASLLGDKVLFEAIGHVNNLPAFQRWHNEIRLLNPLNRSERQQLRRHAMMLDYMNNSMYRFGDELGKSSLTGKLSNAVMKASGMSAVNEWRRGAWALTAMDTLGDVVSRKGFADIGPQDMRLLNSYGVTETDWRVWQLAELDDLGHGNNTALTPESIGRITDAQIHGAFPERMQAVRDKIQADTAELAARNIKDKGWIKGRIDKFDEARDAMNRWVKDRAARRDAGNQEAAGAMRERIDLLDAQREAAVMQAEMEADFNRLASRDEASAFMTEMRAAAADMSDDAKSAIRDARRLGEKLGGRMQRLRRQVRSAQKEVDASADLVVDDAGNVSAVNEAGTVRAGAKLDDAQLELQRAELERDIGAEMAKLAGEDTRAAFRETINTSGREMRRGVSRAVREAEGIGRRHGEAKGRLDRRIKELENRISALDRTAGRAADADAKAVQAKADTMAKDLKQFIERSQARQGRRQAVIDRIMSSEGGRIAEETSAIRRDATIKLLGALTSESHLAVLEPGWEDRAKMYGGLQRGDLRDELTRSFWQFKAFPIAQFERILDVGMSRPTTGGKAGFLTSVPVMLTLAGGMLIQVQEMLAGKDPRPMDEWKFWAAAFLKGGSLGLYGDFLFSQSGTTRYGTGPLEAVAGPTIGAVADMATFIAQAPGKIAEGKDPQVAAKAINIAKGFLPFQNLWYTKAATDHLIFQNAQEALNPGYLESVRSRTQREFGNDWWWAPGEFTPDRPPDVGNAFGNP